MTRTMYDAVNPANIPPDAVMVAGYGDGPESEWPADAWSKWPNAVMVRITTNGQDQSAIVVDCENGDFSPTSAVDEIQRRRARGLDPTEYCGADALWECRHAFDVRGIPQPHWWVADPNKTLELGGGIVALQQGYLGGYDVSVVADFWPGVDTEAQPAQAPSPPTTSPDYPEDNLQAHEIVLPRPLDANGNGYYSAAELGIADVNQIVGQPMTVVRPPASAGGYDAIPRFGIDDSEQLAVEGGVAGGQYGIRLWTV